MDRSLLRNGFFLFLLALLTGIVIPFLKTARLGLSAHMIAVLGALFLIAVGLVWHRLSLGETTKRFLYWLWHISAFGNWLGTLIAAAFGGSSLMPIASSGVTSTPIQETIVMIVILTTSLVSLVVVSITVWGLRGKDDVAN